MVRYVRTLQTLIIQDKGGKMSIMMCEECDRLVDTDYEEMFEVKNFKIICDNCKENEKEEK